MTQGLPARIEEAVHLCIEHYRHEPGHVASRAADDLASIRANYDLSEEESYKLRNLFAATGFQALSPDQFGSLVRSLRTAVPLRLQRVVYLAPDLSTIGGIQNRTRKILRHANSRSVEHHGLSVRRQGRTRARNVLCWDDDPQGVLATIHGWSPASTVVVFPNNTLKVLPTELRDAVEQLPLVFLGSGQLSFLIQDSQSLADVSYARSVMATKCIVLSEADKAVYSQFGLHDRILGFHPTEVRARPANRASHQALRFGYVGRIDFYTKGADRLLNAARIVRDYELAPLRIFTPDFSKNSPDLETFLESLKASQLEEYVEIVYNENSPDVLYADIDLLLVPSRKDSFPNVILEAYSFGVPVVSTSHAPGPSRLVDDGRTGFLLKEFAYTELAGVANICDPRTLEELSEAAFSHHKRFGMDEYFEFIERVGQDALEDFFGWNRTRVFPDLRPIAKLNDRLGRERARLARARAKIDVERKKRKSTQARLRELRAELRAADRTNKELRSRLKSERVKNDQLTSSLRYRLASTLADHPRTFLGILTFPRPLAAACLQYIRNRRSQA
jgi:glycosyltransferase involved in cell wall biosynthesis